MPGQARWIAMISAATLAETLGPAVPKFPGSADRQPARQEAPTLPPTLRKTTVVATMAMAAGTSLVRLRGAQTAVMKLPAKRHRPGRRIRDAYPAPTAHRSLAEAARPRARRIAAAGRNSHRTLTVVQVQPQTVAMTVWTRAAASLPWNCTGPS